MKNLIACCLAILATSFVNAQDVIELSDFKIMDNTNWKGTLTYKDYQSGALKTINATMQFKIEDDRIISDVQYTYEPSKNHRNKIKIKKNGTYFGNEKVHSYSNKKGTKTLVTIYYGKDNGKKAKIYTTHVLTDSTYSVTKEVLLDTSDSRYMRNRYKYTKV